MIRKANLLDANELLRMREKLFDEYSCEELSKEIAENFMGNEHPYYIDISTYVYERENMSLGGFIDISFIDVNKIGYFDMYLEFYKDIAREYAVTRIEAWYVDEDLHSMKIGKELVKKAESWALEKDCSIILSDTDTYRETSKLAHQVMGYQTVCVIPDKELVLFLKILR